MSIFCNLDILFHISDDGVFWAPPRIWCLDRKQFFLVATIEKSTLFAWVYYFDSCGDVSEADDIYYNLSLNTQFEQHSYYGQVRNLEEDGLEIMREKNAFMLDTKSLNRFLIDGDLKFKLKICYKELNTSYSMDLEEGEIE